MTTPTVYRVFTEAGAALYVGSTSRPWWVRFAEQTEAHPELRNLSGRVELTYHQSMVAALEVERAEIARLKPSLNTKVLWLDRRTVELGEVMSAVRDHLALSGPSDSVSVAEALPQLRKQSIVVALSMLRQSGEVVVVGQINRGYKGGRPSYVVQLAAAAA